MKHLIILIATFLLCIQCTKNHGSPENELTLVDFFLPMEPVVPLANYGEAWGDSALMPRDTSNGLEDATLKNWCYWDGSIVKDDDNKYHLFASRWDQKYHHGTGWTQGSKAIHAVSDKLCGKYTDLGETWRHWNQSQGHNVIGLRMHDGRYAMVTSECTSGQVFVSENPYGPWELLGNIKIDNNGFNPALARYDELNDGALRGGSVGNMANVMIILRPEGRYMIIARYCAPMISDQGILGPYKIMADKAWKGVKGIPQFKMEDPTVWFSNGLYHIVVNHHVGDTTYHLTSEDGIHNWKNRGLAYHRNRGVFHHPNGYIENWYTVQRPTVYTENNVVTAFNFSVIDVHKGQDGGNDNHGSKILVIPFDGEAFGKHIQKIVDEENKLADATPPPSPWKSIDIGTITMKGNTGYDAEVNTIRIKASGNNLNEAQDACRFVYQEMSGDISAKVLVLSQNISEDKVLGGLMLRKTLEANSEFVCASISNQTGFNFIHREQQGTKSHFLNISQLEAPYWIRLEKRGNIIACYVSSSNHYNWNKVGETTLTMGENYYVGLAASSINNDTLSLARFKNVDIHPWGKPLVEGIVSHTFPDTIPATGIIDFEIEYETLQTLDVWVELQNVQTQEKHAVLRKRLKKKGVMQLTYNAGTKLNSQSTYWFVIKAVPMHFHDSEHVQSGYKKVVVAP